MWETVYVYYKGKIEGKVHDAEGTLEPEVWVAEHGVRNYPNAIYFFATDEEMGS